jgi:hypothetical protein
VLWSFCPGRSDVQKKPQPPQILQKLVADEIKTTTQKNRQTQTKESKIERIRKN